jgi:hypothetical protein
VTLRRRDAHSAGAAREFALPVAVRAIGSYFLFRMVFQKEPRDLAAIKLYVFGRPRQRAGADPSG